MTYKIQCCAGAQPELVHVDKLLPYQADFEEELHSWLQDEELGGHRVTGTQTDRPVSPSSSLPAPSTNAHPVGGSPPNPGGYESGSEAENKQPLTSTGVPRRGLRSCQQPERYTAARSVRDGCQRAPQLDTAVASPCYY